MAAPAPRKPRLFRNALLAAGIGTGAITVGVLIGYLVNGPPQRPLVPRVVADTSSAASSADGSQTGATAAPAPAAPPPAAAVPAAPDPSAAAAAPAAPDPSATAAAPAAPDPTAAATQMPTAEVREVQNRLRAMGFNPGPVDGSVGPLTENAAKRYQQARGLEVTGAVDRNLLAQLRQETPPSRRYSGNSYASNTAATSRRPRNDFNDFLDKLDRLFR
jgi:peptidoglycan hydrolase-like protein with peptidoglycan-binding domain